MPKPSKKPVILRAAAQVVQERGVLHLTLEAVAEKAGISKGGLLYHFPSKEALVEGMVHHISETYQTETAKYVSEDEHEQGKWTRAYISETFRQSTEEKDMNAGMLAAVGINPELMAPIQEAYQKWRERIETDGLNKTDATIALLAADGLWLSQLFGLAPLDEDEREEVFRRLMEQTLSSEHEKTE
ncbi:TetR/AcrR family transcriptional regulator [Salsuginibacillus kocurii]|uniref:TetR/AcrR family transcriptional regulator n=1 Tax=Salsuginibacillus kocurii TaxID=427078 RepID=UPI0003781A61|nr:TetR/AcrR family transcriptional regulator [Salsuginibacillus kocurii]